KTLQKPNINSNTKKKRIKLKNITKFHSPKNPIINNSPQTTTSNSLSNTNIITTIKITQSQTQPKQQTKNYQLSNTIYTQNIKKIPTFY
ncbi:hypothetical protein ACOIDF_30315, partial [Klebsiella pneumoniae]